MCTCDSIAVCWNGEERRARVGRERGKKGRVSKGRQKEGKKWRMGTRGHKDEKDRE